MQVFDWHDCPQIPMSEQWQFAYLNKPVINLSTGEVILCIENKKPKTWPWSEESKLAVNPLVADTIRTVPDFGKEGKSNIPEDQRAAYMLAMENIIAGKESIRNLDLSLIHI